MTPIRISLLLTALAAAPAAPGLLLAFLAGALCGVAAALLVGAAISGGLAERYTVLRERDELSEADQRTGASR
jgi:hypothetical protein